MHILLALERTTLLVESIHDFSGELVSHALSLALACERDEVLHRDGFLAVSTDLSWHLECSATYTTALHLHLRSDVVECLLPDFQRGLLFILHLVLYVLQCCVEDSVCNTLLSIVHEVVNELCHLHITINWIWKHHTLLWFSFSHFFVCF